METDRIQVNFRLDQETADLLDQRRVALMAEMGRIPTRSEVFRIALTQYLQNPQSAPSKVVNRSRRNKKE